MREARILVVDDHADNRQVLVQRLRRFGHLVTEAADGQEALEAIARERPDLMLLDLMMPVLDGFEVLARLREEDGPFLPVIVVSAASERAQRLRALQEGAHEFVQKPFDAIELEARVRTLLALKATQDQLAERSRALELHNARVEELVLERTAELERANKRLVTADRYKDEFLSVVSHELRTPLTSMLGYASILQSGIAGQVPPEQAQCVEEIKASADRMLTLVNTLLDFAKLKAGRLDLNRRSTDLGELIEEVVQSLRPLFDSQRLNVTVRAELARPILLDRLRIGQVLTNLIGNAIKFTPEGGNIRIEAGLEGDAVVIAIHDTGIGFDEEERTQLFTPFRQLNMSSTREAEGTGLGLSISQALIESHGGAISAHSPGRGKGATFRVTFPASFVER